MKPLKKDHRERGRISLQNNQIPDKIHIGCFEPTRVQKRHKSLSGGNPTTERSNTGMAGARLLTPVAVGSDYG